MPHNTNIQNNYYGSILNTVYTIFDQLIIIDSVTTVILRHFKDWVWSHGLFVLYVDTSGITCIFRILGDVFHED